MRNRIIKKDQFNGPLKGMKFWNGKEWEVVEKMTVIDHGNWKEIKTEGKDDD